MATGRVKYFDSKRGFGFITPDDGGKDVFVHHTAILGGGYRTLDSSECVEFETIDTDKGPKAQNVKRGT